MSASEGSESNCRDSFSSCSEHIDVWSESGRGDIRRTIKKCLGETDISRSPTKTQTEVAIFTD